MTALAAPLPGVHISRRRSNSVRPVEVGAVDDRALVEALRRGDEDAFAALVDRHHQSLLRLARVYVRDRAAAEEVVQDTWLAVLSGVDSFAGRSSLSTWIYKILTNRARTRGARDARQVPFSSLGEPEEVEVSEDRFRPPDAPLYPGGWAVPPRAWPHERLVARESVALLKEAIAQLPPAQQVVVGLRDVEGWSSDEVCEALEISAGNQRVLLHRARSRLRRELEDYLWDK
jgi:RNA polymerase sigma-70 factor (ECF subfamily)